MVQRLSKVRDLLGRAVQYVSGAVRNRLARTPVTGDANVVVSLTSFGPRLKTVHHTIESIAGGSARPRRLLLALDSAADVSTARELRTLRRLRRRGLEIIEAPPMGPHAKYFPYVMSIGAHKVPLVTADDDIIYPREWLSELTAAHRKNPNVIHCFRAHEFGILDGRPDLYARWGAATTTRPRYRTFLTGVSGVIYPPAFLDHLRMAGDHFQIVSPRADDVWLHAQAVQAEVRVAQIIDRPQQFPVLLGTQRFALWRHNTRESGDSHATLGRRTPNDDQIENTYSQLLIARIVEDEANCDDRGRTGSRPLEE